LALCVVLGLAGCRDPGATDDRAVGSSEDPAQGSAAVWQVDREATPGPDDTSFVALVERVDCSDGVNGPVLEPRVVIEAARVEVTFQVGPLPERNGGQCIGNVPEPFEVDLGRPLGDRELWDGGCLVAGPVDLSLCRRS